MSAVPSRALLRARWALGAVAAVELALGVGVAALAQRQTPVSVDDAVEQFRAREAISTTTTTTPARGSSAGEPRGRSGDDRSVSNDQPLEAGALGDPRAPAGRTTEAPGGARAAGLALPAPGVYVYATNGGDEVDFGGASHTYPDETTITVTRHGCGTRYHWEPVQERWDERDTCPSARGELLVAFRSFHEFFGQSDRRDFTCNAGALARPAATAAPSTTWASRCEAGPTVARTTGRIVGTERLRVGDEMVDTVHYVLDSTVSGDGEGTARYEVWMLRDTALMVREIADVDSQNAGPTGPVQYREHYELRLRSLTPRR